MTPDALHWSYQRTLKGWQIVVTHTIPNVSPTMIDWWWDHIDTTEYYQRWHPTDHISFEWLLAPAEVGHVGAVHRVVEFLDGKPAQPATIDIRWEDASNAAAEYHHVLRATISGDVQGGLMHEYEAAPSGTRMKSHFSVESPLPEAMVHALIAHNQNEMRNFSLFLPELYANNNT